MNTKKGLKLSKSSLRSDQSGIASIVIVIMIMIILSTIVLGFSHIIRREVRRSVDRQLSSQAFYAAESGVNDAIKAIKDGGFTGSKTECAPYGAGDSSKPIQLRAPANLLSGDGNVQYSCLLIDPTPQSLIYDNINTDRSTIFPVSTNDGTNPASVYFSWQHKDNPQNAGFRNPAQPTDFPTQSGWNSGGLKTGMLRVDIVPTGGSFGREALAASVKTVFLYPTTNNAGYAISDGTVASVDFNAISSGEIIRGNCKSSNTPQKCIVRLRNVPNGSYMRVKAIYQASTLEITATKANNSTIKLVNAQIMVDSTGLAADVSRRVQVRVPLDDATALPENVLDSMQSLCKYFTVVPDNAYSSGGESTCNPSPN